jgi:hypothetical protein
LCCKSFYCPALSFYLRKEKKRQPLKKEITIAIFVTILTRADNFRQVRIQALFDAPAET